MGAIACDASEVVYIDAGLAGCCVAPDVKRAAVELTLYDIDSGETRKRVLPGTIAPVERRDSAAAIARFPLAWSLVNKKLRILFPDIHSDSVGRIIFLLWTDLDVLSSFNKMPEEAPNGIQLPKGYARQNGVVIYGYTIYESIKIHMCIILCMIFIFIYLSIHPPTLPPIHPLV